MSQIKKSWALNSMLSISLYEKTKKLSSCQTKMSRQICSCATSQRGTQVIINGFKKRDPLTRVFQTELRKRKVMLANKLDRVNLVPRPRKENNFFRSPVELKSSLMKLSLVLTIEPIEQNRTHRQFLGSVIIFI